MLCELVWFLYKFCINYNQKGSRGEGNVDTYFCNTDVLRLWKAFAVFHQSGLGDHQDRIYHRAAAAGPDRHGAGGPDVRRFDPGGDHRGGVAVCVQGVMEKEKVNIEVRVI